MQSNTSKRRPLILSLLVIIVCGIALFDYLQQPDTHDSQVATVNEIQIRDSFSLLDQSGQAVSNESYSDRYKLIFFGFTDCLDVCPSTLSRMAEVLNQLGPNNHQIYPLFITVEPERDTPARLHEYAKAFDPRISYLTGSTTEISRVLTTWGQIRATMAAAKGETSEENYTLQHSSVLYLISPDGKVLEAYTWEVPLDKIALSMSEWLSP
ncbi:MAG: hypothetical protein COA75_06460 [Cellvibrionales bacterium]|nr:MAG: hypothetical protein COA75_06460 [Cellvibrionales bacterium]